MSCCFVGIKLSSNQLLLLVVVVVVVQALVKLMSSCQADMSSNQKQKLKIQDHEMVIHGPAVGCLFDM